MNNWRFLIQQEGDRDWLPLEAPEADILEGRYRLVGQIEPGPQIVDIHLTHREFDSFKVRERHRTAQTNDKGLVGIFPFSRLQPGLWEIECRSAGRAGTLYLRVDPHDGSPELEASSDLSQLTASYGREYSISDSPLAAPSPQAAPQAAPQTARFPQPKQRPQPTALPTNSAAMASVADLFQTVEAVADQVITALSGQFAGNPPPEVDPAAERSPATNPSSVSIELQTSAYRTATNQPLSLRGQILGSKPERPSTMSLILITPSTGKTIAQHVYPQVITHLPHTFDWPVPLAADPDTSLILARLSLRPAAGSEQVWSLAECSFAIMVLPASSDDSPDSASREAYRPQVRSDQRQTGLIPPSVERPEGERWIERGLEIGTEAENPFQFPEDELA